MPNNDPKPVKMTHKLTKQGVRDLDAGRPKPKKSPALELPILQFCKHRKLRTNPRTGEKYCPECEQVWDQNIKEY